jgi:3-hydroxyacyl-CoA dehydrogenase/enoyl-CoA hydratase/3-hydroxybutyryl-CoA epimerase
MSANEPAARALPEHVRLPADAPPAGSCVRITRPEPGLALLQLDPPHRSMPVFDAALLADLDSALVQLESERELRALVIAGKEPLVFVAGADIRSIEAIATPEQARALVRYGQAVFERVARLGQQRGGPLRVVAAAGGAVPGGACELCLACDLIVLAEHEKTRIGLPEVKLGIVPGWGGTQRLPRRIGVPAALAAVLEGRLHTPRAALKLGLVDRLTAPESLLRVASAIALGQLPGRRRERGASAWLVDRNPLATAFAARAARKAALRVGRGHYPAPLAAIELVASAPRTPLARGLEREVLAIEELATSKTSKHLIALFGLAEDAKKLRLLPNGESAPAIRRAAVIGAGAMGGAIASLMAERGLEVRLSDLSREVLAKAVQAHRAEAARLRSRKRLAPHAVDAMIDRLGASTSGGGLARCEFLIEAVAEKLEVKRAVLGSAARALPREALIATNTSSLSVEAIAAGLPAPERVLGVHFFNPVRRMPLVELVRAPQTSPQVLARAARLVLDLGKTPVVVRDVPGFLVNRLLGPYLDEALRLAEEGAALDAIDAALVRFGMPMGPIELLDEVGLDIAAHAAASLHAGYGARMQASAWTAPLVAAGELGKKTGLGLRRWERGPAGKLRAAGNNPRLPAPSSRAAAELDAPALAERCVLAMVLEARRALAERVVASGREIDLATVFGLGFAPFRGGLWSHGQSLGEAPLRSAAARIASEPSVARRTGGPERFQVD